MTGLADGFAAVVFDFFGTLTPGTPDEVWLDHAARLAAVLDVDGPALRAALHASFPERATGSLGDLPQTLRFLAGQFGVQLTGDRLAVACRVRRQFQCGLFALRPEALPAIRSLRARGLKIGVLSDCTAELPDAWPELGVSGLVDAPVFSCVVGIRKPDARLFAKVSGDLGVDPGGCLYVGDGGSRELSGARLAGMHAVLLAAGDRPAGSGYDRERDWDGPSIGSLDEL